MNPCSRQYVGWRIFGGGGSLKNPINREYHLKNYNDIIKIENLITLGREGMGHTQKLCNAMPLSALFKF
jgi:hypothetical protein